MAPITRSQSRQNGGNENESENGNGICEIKILLKRKNKKSNQPQILNNAINPLPTRQSINNETNLNLSQVFYKELVMINNYMTSILEYYSDDEIFHDTNCQICINSGLRERIVIAKKISCIKYNSLLYTVYYDIEKTGPVQTISKLLSISDKCICKYQKCVIICHIYNFLLLNFWFLSIPIPSIPRFAYTSIKKADELIYEIDHFIIKNDVTKNTIDILTGYKERVENDNIKLDKNIKRG